MADRWLTLADVWQPESPVNAYMNIERMRQARMDNQLNQLKINEAMREIQRGNAFKNALAAMYQPAQPQAGTPGTPDVTMTTPNNMLAARNIPGLPASSDYRPAQPGGFDTSPEKMNALFQADAPKAVEFMQTQQAQQTRQLEEITKVADVIHKLGPEKFKALQPALAEISPVFKSINPALIKAEGGKILYPASTPDGKPISNTYLAYDDDNKLHIVKGGEEKTKTPEQITEAALAEKLGRKPTAIELQNEMDEKTEEKEARSLSKAEKLIEDRAKFEAERPQRYYQANKREIDSVVNAIADSRESYEQIKSRNPQQAAAVLYAFNQKYPKGDLIAADANALARKDVTNSQIIKFTGAVESRIDILAKKAKTLKNTDTPALNLLFNWWGTQTGHPEVVDFDSFKTAIILDATRAMTGGVPTDIRFETELKNIKTAGSPSQLAAAINNLKSAVHITGEAALKLPYSKEQVTGIESPANQPVGGASPVPRKGDMMGGYIFMGGDPNDKNNWKAR